MVDDKEIRLIDPMPHLPTYTEYYSTMTYNEVIEEYGDILTDKQLIKLKELTTMKKYKLKKWYPGLPTDWVAGTVVQKAPNMPYYVLPNATILAYVGWEQVENYPEYWAKYLFTTEDKVDIFMGDRYCTGLYSVHSNLIAESITDGSRNGKTFSTMELLTAYQKADSQVKPGDWVMHRILGYIGRTERLEDRNTMTMYPYWEVRACHSGVEHWQVDDVRKATNDEILEYLLKGANKKGFKVGSKVKTAHTKPSTLEEFTLITKNNYTGGSLTCKEEFISNGIHLAVSFSSFLYPISEVKLVPSITFGGKEVTLEYRTDRTPHYVGVVCSGVKGSLDELIAIKSEILEYMSQKKLSFGNVEFNHFIGLRADIRLDSCSLRIIDGDGVKIGCTTGTWKELCNIITEGEKLLKQ
jgi:hypothetical protein